jgi:hypothetical protein
MKSMWGILVAVVLVGAGCKQPTDPHLTPEPPPASNPDLAVGPVSPSLKVVADDPAALDGPTQSLFKIMQMRYLLVRLQTPTLGAGVSWVTLKVSTPFNSPYHERRVPFSTDPNVTQIESPMMAGQMIDVFRATPIPGGFGLDMTILVGGSNIQRHPMPGLWQVSAELERSSVHAEQSIELGMMQ